MLQKFANAGWITLIEHRLKKSAAGHATSLNWILKSWSGTNSICLLDSDAYPIKPGWLDFLLAQQPGAIGCEHFRDTSLLHPCCMLFNYDDYQKANKPSFSIINEGEIFYDTAMIVGRELQKFGVKLQPLSREKLGEYVLHRWCGTRRENATGSYIDNTPKTDYDTETHVFLTTNTAKEALSHTPL